MTTSPTRRPVAGIELANPASRPARPATPADIATAMRARIAERIDATVRLGLSGRLDPAGCLAAEEAQERLLEALPAEALGRIARRLDKAIVGGGIA